MVPKLITWEGRVSAHVTEPSCVSVMHGWSKLESLWSDAIVLIDDATLWHCAKLLCYVLCDKDYSINFSLGSSKFPTRNEDALSALTWFSQKNKKSALTFSLELKKKKKKTFLPEDSYLVEFRPYYNEMAIVLSFWSKGSKWAVDVGSPQIPLLLFESVQAPLLQQTTTTKKKKNVQLVTAFLF